jgi:hypothetical protein
MLDAIDRAMADLHMCNVHRRDDRGSRWIRDNILSPCGDHRDLILKIALARFVNEPDALVKIDWLKPYDPVYLRNVLGAHQAAGGSIHRNAFKGPMPRSLNDDVDWERWNTVGMAIYAASGGAAGDLGGDRA